MSTDGIMSAPLQIGAKLLLSRPAQIMPGGTEVWRKPLIEVDREFVQDCLKYINSVKYYENITPLPRQLIGIGEKFLEVVIFHDGSGSSAGASIYLVVQESGSCKRNVKICRAATKTQDASNLVI